MDLRRTLDVDNADNDSFVKMGSQCQYALAYLFSDGVCPRRGNNDAPSVVLEGIPLGIPWTLLTSNIKGVGVYALGALREYFGPSLRISVFT